VLLKGDPPDFSFDAPMRIYPGALLCQTRGPGGDGVTWVPMKDAVPLYPQRLSVVAWEEDKEQNASFEGDGFADRRQVACTQRPCTKMNSPGDPETILYDLLSKKEVWTAKGCPIELNESHAFQTPGEWR
jgi:hypothetical protein